MQRILGAEDGAAVERERELHVAVGDEPAGLQDNQPVQKRASVGRPVRRGVPSGCAAVERGGSGIVEGTVHRRDEDRIGGEQVHVRVERERREEQGEAGGESGRGSQEGGGGARHGGSGMCGGRAPCGRPYGADGKDTEEDGRAGTQRQEASQERGEGEGRVHCETGRIRQSSGDTRGEEQLQQDGQGCHVHADEGGRDAQRSDQAGIQRADIDGEPVHNQLRDLLEADGLGDADTVPGVVQGEVRETERRDSGGLGVRERAELRVHGGGRNRCVCEIQHVPCGGQEETQGQRLSSPEYVLQRGMRLLRMPYGTAS